MMRRCSLLIVLAAVGLAQAQTPAPTLADTMKLLVETPAIPGYEADLAHKIAENLRGLKPTTDAMSNVVVTVGSGAPHRLLVAPMDEPGFIVSGATPDGYLRLQRLPQGGVLPRFNELYAAQPVRIQSAAGRWIDAVVAGLSVHLQPGRQHPPSLDDLDNLYLEVGAHSAAEARAAADLLSPMAVDRSFYQMGFGRWTGAAIGDRFGAAALLAVLRHLDRAKLAGTLSVAFVAQQWTGARGLDRVLQQLHPDEVVYVGRITRSAPRAGSDTPPAALPEPGGGVLLATQAGQSETSPLGEELQKLAAQHAVAIKTAASAPLLARAATPLPARFAHLAVGTAWPSTPAEMLDANEVASVVRLLDLYLTGQAAEDGVATAAAIPDRPLPARPTAAPTPESLLTQLIERYGVSEHEAPVRELVQRLLPSWAKPETDASGNLVLRWGSASAAPRLVAVAHMDELGYVVRAIRPDGRLELDNKGGGAPPFYQGHPVLVHTANGMRPGVLELPPGWEQPNFQWPRDTRSGARLDVGARTPDEFAQLGIQVGDFVTIPKRFRKLLGSRVSGRAMDDRAGCTALLAAVWALGPQLAGRNVTFVWSTAEETGLVGAGEFAKRAAAANRTPEFVFAVDTFVSADSPLESQRFADTPIGQGFVIRAVDNSSITPRKTVERLVALARAGHIPVQYGTTGGGNDGSTFLRYGSTDVGVGWPLRYSHSPGEVIDLRDVDALARILEAVARQW